MGEREVVSFTVVALYDDDIDAEHALAALKKSDRAPGDVSVLVRDRQAASDGGGALDVTQAIMHTAASTVGGWLQGLATLLVPNQGRLVVAGPIGAVLGHMDDVASDPGAGAATELAATDVVGFAFERFGFRADEAHYLEQRVEAGSAVIAVTTDDPAQLEAVRRLFADHDAVYIGQAQTATEVVDEAEELIANPAVVATQTVVVTDVVAPFRRLCGGSGSPWCGAPVLDEAGEDAGEVDDVIADPGEGGAIRYIVVAHGGLLGLARKRAAVPVEIVDFDDEAVRVRASRAYVHAAPAYDPDTPFSRSDELATCGYFATSLPGRADGEQQTADSGQE